MCCEGAHLFNVILHLYSPRCNEKYRAEGVSCCAQNPSLAAVSTVYQVWWRTQHWFMFILRCPLPIQAQGCTEREIYFLLWMQNRLLWPCYYYRQAFKHVSSTLYSTIIVIQAKESACGTRALHHPEDWNENEASLKIATRGEGGLRVAVWRALTFCGF